MTIEEMRQKSAEARKIALDLRRQLQGITDPEQRKQLSRQMNDLFVEAKKLMDEVKAQRGWEASVERELNSMEADDWWKAKASVYNPHSLLIFHFSLFHAFTPTQKL